MRLLSSTDVAIAIAVKAGTLAVTERQGRFGAFWSVDDQFGAIEVWNTAAEAAERVASIKGRAGL